MVERVAESLFYDICTDREMAHLLRAIGYVESRFNPLAESPAGAQGLMQIMPAMQKALGVDDPFSPVKSIMGAQRLLTEELRRFGRLSLAVAAYNAGSPAVHRALSHIDTQSFDLIEQHLPEETVAYTHAVLRRYHAYAVGV